MKPPRSLGSLPPEGRVSGFGGPGATDMTASRIHFGQMAVGLAMLALALLLAAGAAGFPVDKGYSILGPQVFPFAVAAFIGVVAVLLCGQAATGGFRNLGEEQPAAPSRSRVSNAAWVSAGILAVAALITHLGFVLSAAVLFACAARGYGSRAPARDLAIGVAMTLPVFWLFTRGLGMSLPPLVNAWI